MSNQRRRRRKIVELYYGGNYLVATGGGGKAHPGPPIDTQLTTRSLNPIPYSADYFGHKVHVDQNEKLVLYGVTHICAIDGYSNKIVAFITMPIKNCIEIYSHLYK